jgi:hypothetical protein
LFAVYPDGKPNVDAKADLFIDGKKVGKDRKVVALPEKAGSYKAKAVWGKAKVEKTVSAQKDAKVKLKLPYLPACSDGFDNDGDGKVDAYDTGCVDDSENPQLDADGKLKHFDPDDDNELLSGETLIGYGIPQDSLYVSGKNGPQKVHYTNWDFRPSIVASVGKIKFTIDVLYSSSIPHQDFSLVFKCGPDKNHRDNITKTDVVYDNSDLDGWVTRKVTGLTHNFVKTGRDCGIYAQSKGSGRVIFYIPGKKIHNIVAWSYEKENLPESAKSVKDKSVRYENGIKIKTLDYSEVDLNNY